MGRRKDASQTQPEVARTSSEPEKMGPQLEVGAKFGFFEPNFEDFFSAFLKPWTVLLGCYTPAYRAQEGPGLKRRDWSKRLRSESEFLLPRKSQTSQTVSCEESEEFHLLPSSGVDRLCSEIYLRDRELDLPPNPTPTDLWESLPPSLPFLASPPSSAGPGSVLDFTAANEIQRSPVETER